MYKSILIITTGGELLKGYFQVFMGKQEGFRDFPID